MFYVLSTSKTQSFLYPQLVLAFVPFLCSNTQSHTHMCAHAHFPASNHHSALQSKLLCIFSLLFLLQTVSFPPIHSLFHLQLLFNPKSQSCAVLNASFCVTWGGIWCSCDLSQADLDTLLLRSNWVATWLFAGNAWQQELILLLFITELIISAIISIKMWGYRLRGQTMEIGQNISNIY